MAAGQMRPGTKEGASPNCWDLVGDQRPPWKQEMSSQMALVQTGKKVAGAVGGKPRAPAWAAGAAGSVGLAEGHLLEQDATAPSEGAAGCQPLVCLCTGLHASQANCNFSDQSVCVKYHRIRPRFHWVLMPEQASQLSYSRALPASILR